MQMNLDLQTKIEYLWDNQNELANKESQKIVGSVLELLWSLESVSTRLSEI